jgi:Ni/Co efflux regulator RcnB
MPKDDDHDYFIKLDGGPAAGQVVRIKGARWSPEQIVRVRVRGRQVAYVLAEQRPPPRGEPWVYVHAGSAHPSEHSGSVAADDPNDD